MAEQKYRFVRNDIPDDFGFLKLQDKILEIMVYIDRFCREHDITYYLMGGSALGAMRHGGFIPWDDDLDIFMPYKDYMRFLKLCETELDTERFYLQKEDTEELPYFYSKIRMNGTAYIEDINRDRKGVHQGIFVDIMCLNHAAPKGLKRDIQFACGALLRASAISKLPQYDAGFKKKVIIELARIFVRGPIKKAVLNTVRKYNDRQTEDVAHIFGRAKKKNAYYPAKLFESGRPVPFEQVELMVPNGVEEYLTLRYGPKYMEMPDEKTKAIYKAHAAKWDTEKDFSEVLADAKDRTE